MNDFKQTPEYYTYLIRRNLSYAMVAVVFLMVGYVLHRWGDDAGLRNLIIGFLLGGGCMGAVTALWFNATPSRTPSATVQQSAENITNVPTAAAQGEPNTPDQDATRTL